MTLRTHHHQLLGFEKLFLKKVAEVMHMVGVIDL